MGPRVGSPLRPTADQRFEIARVGEYDFAARRARAEALQAEGRTEEACNERLRAFSAIAELLPEEEPAELSWEHGNTREAIEIIRDTAVDHFLLGDLEMAMGMLELLLDVDPEDHTGSVDLLALCYVAAGEWESFDAMTLDLSDKSAAAVVARLWAVWRRQGRVDAGLRGLLQRNFAACWREFTADEHAADEAYVRDISSDRPSREAEARELWLKTEPLWREFPDFIEALRRCRDAAAGR